MILDAITRKLERKLSAICKQAGYIDDEIESGEAFRIQSKNVKSDRCVDIYVYTDLSLDEFVSELDNLTEVVTKFDPGAYFDLVEPGVAMARLYWDVLNQYKDTSDEILTSPNLTKLGESICIELEDSYDEEFYVDDIKYIKTDQVIEITVSSATFESTATARVHEYELESYSDLREAIFYKLLRKLGRNIREI